MDKYEEALERAKEIYNAPVATIVTRTFLEQIFPELKESEDERIRKCLIDMVKRETGFTGFPSQGQVLAYLEKQKEQKPVARESDFVNKPKNSVEILKHYLTWATSEEENCPYSWKELADAIRDGIKALEEQHPAEWSEEDGLARDFLLKQTEQSIKVLESVKTETYIGSKGLGYVASDIRDWKNARQFILSLHPHWKPSEEQMQYLLAVINDLNNAGAESCHLILVSLYEQLKRL